MRFENGDLEILAAFTNLSAAQRYAWKTAYQADIAVYDMSSMGIVEQ
jgi:hypothetical protein